jgi:hypothetical protein
MGDEFVLEATFLLPLFLGMGVVGEGLVDTNFFLMGVAVLLLTGALLFSPVLEPGGDLRPGVVLVGPPPPLSVGEDFPEEVGDTVGFFVGFDEVTEVLFGT